MNDEQLFMSSSYEILPPSDVMSSGYILPNGSWTGAAGLLERRVYNTTLN